MSFGLRSGACVTILRLKVIPFGGQYKGFAVPDGLIANIRRHQKIPILFYDCKSFAGDKYRHKPDIPMQANYYQDFLEDFFVKGDHDNAGFIIFSSAFPEDVHRSITGSAQWNYVQSRCTIFFINVDSMEQLDALTGSYGYEFDRQVLFDICFTDNLTALEDHEVTRAYEELFPASAYSAFRFVLSDQLVVAFVAACISQYEQVRKDGLAIIDEGLQPIMRRAKHENLKRNITNPTLPEILQDFMQAVKDKRVNQFLNPLARLLILKRFENLAVLAMGEKQYMQQLSDAADR